MTNRTRTLVGTALAGLGLGVAIFVFYLLVYRVRHYPAPVGFDAPWYVWRADFVAARGLGPVGTAVRPGYALLAAVLGSAAGTSQLELQVVLPFVLVSVLALGAGSFFDSAFGGGRWAWIVTAGVAGLFLGATRLVGENVSNLLFMALAAGALACLCRRVEGRRGLAGCVLLLVAAGLSHWIFLAVLGVVLGVLAVLCVPESVRQRRAGVPMWRTETGLVAAAGAWTGGAMAVLIAGILRAPFQTVEIREDPRRYVPKLRTDLARLVLPVSGPLMAAGAWDLEQVRRPARSRFGLRLLLAWTLVAAVGIVAGVVWKGIPPHRSLALWVGLPGVVLFAAAVVRAAEWLRSRRGRWAGVAVAVLGVAVAGVIGGAAWYGQGPGVWISPVALRQAEAAAAYVEQLPAGQPFVFLVSSAGKAGVLSVALKERTIRVALPPERQPDAYVFVGDARDVLSGRRTPLGPRMTDATSEYWDAVRTVLPTRPPVLVLRGMAEKQFREATEQLGATVIAPGVALIQGLPPNGPLSLAPPPRLVPPLRLGLLRGALLLVLLGVAGGGWAIVILGADAPVHTLVGMAPAVGAAGVILAAVMPARLGVGAGGGVGIAVLVAVAAAGWIAARVAGRSS